jgi:hypothetical protein
MLLPEVLTPNQPVPFDTEAVKGSEPLPLDTATVLAGGVVPPIWKAKLSEDGSDDKTGAGDTTKVTGTLSGLFEAPAAVTEMLPLYVPAAKPAGFTDAVSVAGVLPLGVLTDNQPAPLATVALKASVVLHTL